MKKLILALLLFASLPAMAAEDESAYERVMRTNTLRCGYVVTEALQKEPNTGEITGIIPDVLNEAGRLLNIKIEWTEELNWGNFVEAMRSHRVDAICTNFWMDPSGSKYVSYTIPLYYSGVGAYVRADETRFKGDNLEALNDPSVKVSSMEGEMSGLIADQDYPKASKVIVPQIGDASQLLMDVTSNKADIAFVDVAIGKRFERNNAGKLKNLVSDHPVRVFANTIALPPNEPQLKTMLDATLSQLLYGGFVDRVLKKHITVSDGYYPVARPYEVPK
jgi:ABC-type amino acid transport substrate-binding protein